MCSQNINDRTGACIVESCCEHQHHTTEMSECAQPQLLKTPPRVHCKDYKGIENSEAAQDGVGLAFSQSRTKRCLGVKNGTVQGKWWGRFL